MKRQNFSLNNKAWFVLVVNYFVKICNIEPVWISDFEFDLTLQETSKFEPFVIEKEEKREKSWR